MKNCSMGADQATETSLGAFLACRYFAQSLGTLGPGCTLYGSEKPMSQDFVVGPHGPVDQQETGPRYTGNRKA